MNESMTKTDSKSEFLVILDEFKIEVSELTDMTCIISTMVANLKEFRQPQKEVINPPSSQREDSVGIIIELQVLINRMREQNTLLRETKSALIQFIG